MIAKHVITNYVLQGVVRRLSETRGFSPDLLTRHDAQEYARENHGVKKTFSL